MSTSDDIFAGLAGVGKGVQDVLGTLLQFKLRQQGDYINIDEIPQNLRDELGITQTSGRINKSVLSLYKTPSYVNPATGEVIATRGQRPYTPPQKKPPQEYQPFFGGEPTGEPTTARPVSVGQPPKPPSGAGGGSQSEIGRIEATNKLRSELSGFLRKYLDGKGIAETKTLGDLPKKYINANWQSQEVKNLIKEFPQEYRNILNRGMNASESSANFNLPVVRDRNALPQVGGMFQNEKVLKVRKIR